MSSRRSRRNIQPDRNENEVNQGNQGNYGNQGNANGQFNMNLGQLLNNIDINQVMGQLSQMMGGGGLGPMPNSGQQNQMPPPRPAPRDPRIDLLQAMKPFLNPRRVEMIDRIGQFYAITKILQSNNKKR